MINHGGSGVAKSSDCTEIGMHNTAVKYILLNFYALG